ncbi:MAG: rhombosortase [Sulfuricaulis sp.]|nr:rhombosortase [Sulfuricaulis sp.]
MEAAARLKAGRLPFWTLTICAGAVLIFLSSILESILIFDRTAIAHGEIWRLVTGNLVHFSALHLAYDLSVLFVAGAIIEIRGYRYYPVLCLTAALFIGIVLYRAEPDMLYFAGLSGVATAAIVYLCLHGLTEKGAWRWVCAAALFGLGIKFGIELTFNESLLFATGSREFLPAPLSHLVGAVTALFLFALSRLRERNSLQIRPAQ